MTDTASLQCIMNSKLNASVHLYDVAECHADGIEVSVCDPSTGEELSQRWIADKAASPRVQAKSLATVLYQHGKELGDDRMDWVNSILQRLADGDFND